MRLTVEHGTFSYGGKNVLSDIGFDFESGGGRGRILSVLGPNGAGKTTFIRCLLGLLAWKRGRTLLDGEDIRRYSRREFWSRIGYVPQAKTPSFATTVLEMVVLGRNPRLGEFALPAEADWEEANSALKKIGIERLGGRRCDEISGGEYQLALIARALSVRPQLLVLDEPESNLDFRNQRRVLDVIESLRNEGIGSVINTHFPAHALELSDEAVLMRKGRPPLSGAAPDVLTEDNLTDAFGIQVRIRSLSLPEGDRTAVIAVSGSGTDSLQ